MNRSKNRRVWTGSIAALSMALVLAGCSSSTSDEASTAETSAAEEVAAVETSAAEAAAEGEPLTIGVSFYSQQIPLFVEMLEGVNDLAAELGVEIIFADGGGSAEEQTNQIENMITSGVDAIIASPVDANAMVPAYESATAAGIPIFSAANKVADEFETGFVGPDLVSYATQTLDRLIDCMGGEGELVLITGPPQISFVQLQQLGWDASLANNPNVKVVQTLVDEDLSTAKAVDLANAALTANPNVKGILSSTDNIGVGVEQAIKGQGLDPKSICTAGWDAQPNAVELVKAGSYDLTLSYLGYKWGQVALETAIAAAEGNLPASHYIVTDGLFIDSSNVNDLTADQIKGKTPIS
ncbi:MAG: sugar ABC transporter substrate-binding protein [Candidatus Nanopelagicales bacterium]|jgi:ABC-type sugar transport system substrate-binding protein|nr:sugar ABC transporter substrate-binding protein [Candidatus Nanopelagicales bacterium]